jgi:hypothetical protein
MAKTKEKKKVEVTDRSGRLHSFVPVHKPNEKTKTKNENPPKKNTR